jgi:hypothetical protein
MTRLSQSGWERKQVNEKIARIGIDLGSEGEFQNERSAGHPHAFGGRFDFMRIVATIRHACWTAPALLLLAGPTRGQSPPGSLPAPPTPAPSAAIVMAERFQSLDAWRPDREGVWSVERGMLQAHLPDKPQDRSLIYVGSEDWGDYAVDLDVFQSRGADKGLVVRVRGDVGIGVDLRGGEYQDVLVYRREVPLGHAQAPNPDRQWHHLRVEARGNSYSVLVDGRLVLRCHDRLPGARHGRIALPAYTGGKGICSVLYANVVVTSLTDQRAAFYGPNVPRPHWARGVS